MVRFVSVIFCAVVLTAGVVAQEAAPEQYADIKQTFDMVTKAVDALEHDVDQAQNASDVAQGFTKFGQTMRAFKLAVVELQSKYPDMGAHGAAPPPDVNDSLTAMQASLGKIPAILKKAEPYATDPAVQEAIDKMNRGD
jgi:hypothetical protein